jgi:hypothetical protein
MKIQRRELLVSGLKTLGATGLLAQMGSIRMALAQVSDGSKKTIVVKNSITRNHGHGFEVDLAGLVLLLRETTASGEVLLDIQGTSGHAHSISLNSERLIQLLIDGTLEVESSKDAGHTHMITISLEVTEPTPPAESAV